MDAPKYNNKKTVASNLVEIFRFTKWLFDEMLHGRVEAVTDRTKQNEHDILQAQADFVQSVEDEYNALCE